MPSRTCARHGQDYPCTCAMGNLYRFVEPVVLFLLSKKGRSYGYDLSGELQRHALTDAEIERAALYRVLRQLEVNGNVTSEWEVEKGGPARRLYRLTTKAANTSTSGSRCSATCPIRWHGSFGTSVGWTSGARPARSRVRGDGRRGPPAITRESSRAEVTGAGGCRPRTPRPCSTRRSRRRSPPRRCGPRRQAGARRRTRSSSCASSTGLARYPSGGGTCLRDEMNVRKSSETPVMMMTGIERHSSVSRSSR